MKIITTSTGYEIKVYSSAKEMPIGRYADFQKYLASEVNFESIYGGLLKGKAFAQEGMIEDSIIEFDNAIFGLNAVKNGIGVLSHCFAVMVAEIGYKGQVHTFNDTTIDGLNIVIEVLQKANISQFELENSVEELKKK